MAPPLTVRNLCPKPISIQHIERFLDLDILQSKSSGHFLRSNTSPAFPTSPALGEHSQNFEHQDVDVTLKPFESYILEEERQDNKQHDTTPSNTTLRLTIQTATGERYRISTHLSHTQRSTPTVTALSANLSESYRALFHPTQPTPHLTIHSNYRIKYDRWMADIPDTIPLSAISIPGTHNSHTYYRALPSVRCQHVDIKTQLENGIRFLDIRLQPVHATDTRKKALYLVHGAFPVSLTGPKYFDPLLQTCYDFLAAHPSETILISLKREGVGSATDEHLAQILDQHYIAPNAPRWYTGASTPYLGAVRGKLILLRRYHTAAPTPITTTTITTTVTAKSGIDATPWPENTPHALFPAAPTPTPHTTQLCLQDTYELALPSQLPNKLTHCTAHLSRAAAFSHPIPGVSTDIAHLVPPAPLFLNFLSASNFWNKACWPGRVARVLNRGVEEWVCGAWYLEGDVSKEVGVGMCQGGRVRRKARDGDGGTGVVIMDYVGEGDGGWELVRLIVGCNMGILGKISGEEWW